jgi:hypothetical protein
LDSTVGENIGTSNGVGHENYLSEEYVHAEVLAEGLSILPVDASDTHPCMVLFAKHGLGSNVCNKTILVTCQHATEIIF